MKDKNIFTVGDKTTNGIIKEFKISGNMIRVYFENMPQNYNMGINSIEHVSPLFTTEDGVDIRENDPIYEIIDFTLHTQSCSAGATINYSLLKTKGILYFSTKESAQKYVDDNKPIYSKKQAIQMLRAFDKAITDYDEGDDEGYREYLL